VNCKEIKLWTRLHAACLVFQQTNRSPIASRRKSRGNERKPTGVKRASSWSPEVEEQYRLQQVGWRNLDEYVVEHGEPERWATNDFLKCLRVKKTGNYTYWREWRECEDKYLNRVKIFTY